MKTKTIQIQIPEGWEVKDFNHQTGEGTIGEVLIPVQDRIKTMEDVFAAHETSEEAFEEECGNMPDHLKWQLKAELLVKALNEGWTPDWADYDEWKYFPRFQLLRLLLIRVILSKKR